MKYMLTILNVLYSFTFVFADLPTNCSYEDTVGKWKLYLSHSDGTNEIDCSKKFQIEKELKVQLAFPNYAVDEFGNEGTWSMIYNQGFEIILNGRRYFAFQYYKKISLTKTISFCHQTFNGWQHDLVTEHSFPPKNWGCFNGTKLFSSPVQKISEESMLVRKNFNEPYGISETFIDKINKQQSSWKAGVYEEYQGYTLGDMIRRGGGIKKFPRIHPMKASAGITEMASQLPDSFDWRDRNGQNFVSPIRNQGKCGSCYAFASMATLEAGVRVETNNSQTPVFSTQNIVSCSQYSQGCDGGFPYLVAGMYGQDYGVITEDCYPYVGNDTKCNPLKEGARTYVSNYGYIGEFYGGCNEPLMRIALVTKGPIAVSIEVYEDLSHYKSGIYHHTGIRYKFNPFEITNHVVVIVGYGEENGEKFWIVKNSWGTSWGEDGFFRIRRGTDEIAIESIAVYAKPYVR